MAITKTADILGAGIGAYRSGSLSSQDADLLRRHYGLDEDSNLVVRNAGRGLLGGWAGGAAGLGLGALTRNPQLTAAGGLGGYIAGSSMATDKYSKGEARAIRRKMRERAQDLEIAKAMQAAKETPAPLPED